MDISYKKYSYIYITKPPYDIFAIHMDRRLQQLKKNPALSIGIFIYLVFLIVMMLVGVIDEPDSAGYIDTLINRPPLYPLLIDLFQLVFGDGFYGPLLLFQLLLGVAAMYSFIRTLNMLFSPNAWVLLGFSLIVMAPYYFYLKLGNMIMTEGLAYPLFLYFMSFLFRGFFFERRKDLYLSLLILFLLNITRGQFLFVFPLVFVMIVYLMIRYRALKKYLLILLLLPAIPIVGSLVDKTYHKLYHGHFVSTPWTGLHISALPFFVSDEEDYNIFETTEEQEYFRHVYRELTLAGLTLHEFNKTHTGSRGFGFYAENSTNIANGIIDGKGTHFFDEEELEVRWILNDRMSKKMAFPLILDNFGTWSKFYIMNIIAGMGHEKLLFLYPIFLLFSLVYIIIRRFQRLDVYIFLCFLMALSNIALVAFAQPLTFYRYTIYGDFLIYSAIVILLSHRLYMGTGEKVKE